LRETYARGRAAFVEAAASSAAEVRHEYRKRVKYTWYHVRLLTAIAPSVLEPLGRRLHDLSDALGAEHDLFVLGRHVRSTVDDAVGADERAAVAVVIDGQRADLGRRAVRLGSRLHAESPDAFVERIGCYWGAWHRYGPEQPAGEIEALSPADDGLDVATVRELRRRARALEIAGRSGLRRQDLIGAIRASEGQ
jgi:CHAD domain/Rho termination factor, N-terminal domain